MESPTSLREFLTSRRNRLTPSNAGLPNFGGRRRVAGLRREEVALLAGISTEYYIRLERGNAPGVSDSVLNSICRALQLNETERIHLFNLARGAGSHLKPSSARLPRPTAIKPALQHMIDGLSANPIFVQNGRLDSIAANSLGKALFMFLFEDDETPMNAARFVFLDPRAKTFYPNWKEVAEQLVPVLHSEAGRSPYDRALTDLVGELTTRSALFSELWASRDVREHGAGTKRINHPIVGELELHFEAMNLVSEPELQLLVFSARQGSTSAENLQLLSNWALSKQAHPQFENKGAL